MLGPEGVRDAIEGGQIAIEPFDQRRLRGGAYELGTSARFYRWQPRDRPIHPLDVEGASDPLGTSGEHSGELVVTREKPVTVLSRERLHLKRGIGFAFEQDAELTKLGLEVKVGLEQDGMALQASGCHSIPCIITSQNPTPVIILPGQPLGRLRFHERGENRSDAEIVAPTPLPEFDGLVETLLDQPLYIGITGLAATGKSEAANMLGDLLEAKSHSLGDVIRSEVQKRGLEATGANLDRVSTELREEHGAGIVASRLAGELQDSDETMVTIIEGIRSPAEIEVLRAELSDSFVLLGLHASKQTRINRLLDRGRSDDTGAEAIEQRDEKESGFGVREALGMSDYIITNEGSLQDLEREVERALGHLLVRRAA